MLTIFKNFLSKTSILDDFSFYESRQKAMQDKRIRPPTPCWDHLQVLLFSFFELVNKYMFYSRDLRCHFLYIFLAKMSCKSNYIY